MNPFEQFQLQQTRRTFFRHAAMGVGGVALSSLLNPLNLLAKSSQTIAADKWKGVVNPPHFPAQSQTRDLSLHGGRAVASGDL